MQLHIPDIRKYIHYHNCLSLIWLLLVASCSESPKRIRRLISEGETIRSKIENRSPGSVGLLSESEYVRTVQPSYPRWKYAIISEGRYSLWYDDPRKRRAKGGVVGYQFNTDDHNSSPLTGWYVMRSGGWEYYTK